MDVLEALKIVEHIVYWEIEYELSPDQRKAMVMISKAIKEHYKSEDDE